MPEDDDKDEKVQLHAYYYTFGYGHHMGPEKTPLKRCFTTIKATDQRVATAIMQLRRGVIWANCYSSAKRAGVQKFKLAYIPFDDVRSQVGPNL